MILVGIPHTRDFTGTVVDAVWSLRRPDGTQFKRMPDRNIDDARNRLSLVALHEKAESLLLWDSDQRPPAGALHRLIDRKKDVVGCLTFGRTWPHYPVSLVDDKENKDKYRVDREETFEFISRYARLLTTPDFTGALLPPDDPNVLVPRAALGMAFTLIKCKVLEAMMPDWREMEKAGKVPQWFVSHDGLSGEDSYFCERAKEKGFEIWMDRSVVVGHGYGDQHINPIDFLAFMKYLKTLPQDEYQRVSRIGM